MRRHSQAWLVRAQHDPASIRAHVRPILSPSLLSVRAFARGTLRGVRWIVVVWCLLFTVSVFSATHFPDGQAADDALETIEAVFDGSLGDPTQPAVSKTVFERTLAGTTIAARPMRRFASLVCQGAGRAGCPLQQCRDLRRAERRRSSGFRRLPCRSRPRCAWRVPVPRCLSSGPVPHRSRCCARPRTPDLRPAPEPFPLIA